jgi:nucleotidyltransferase substrate binding protein (TIGR01987 family)
VDRLHERLSLARRALQNLQELASRTSVSPVERDAAIQRFEYTFEALWKGAQLFLREREGLDVGSPKATLRAAFRVGLVDDADLRRALEMADDRNRTVHTYNEAVAQAIFVRLAEYALTVDRMLSEMEHRAGS